MPDEKDLLNILRDKELLVTWPAFIVILLICGAVCLALDFLLKEVIPLTLIRIVLYGLFLLIVFYIWKTFRDRLPERTTPASSAIGIAFAVETTSAEARELLENEFIPEFKHQIDKGKLGDLIETIPSDKYQASRIGKVLSILEGDKSLPLKPSVIQRTKDNWATIHKTIRADFYLWGKLYKLEGKYVLNFKSHADENLVPEVREQLAADYEAFGIKKRIIDASDAIEGVAVEAKFYYIVAKYVVSFIALYTGNLELSYRLDESLEKDFELAEEFQSKEHLLTQLRSRLSTHHFLRARIAIGQSNLSEGEEELMLAMEYDSTNGSAYMFKGALEYLYHRRIDSAWSYIQKAKEFSPPGDDAHKYSEAFLLMAKSNYPAALNLYEYIFENPREGDHVTVNQVIEFNEAVLNQEPKFVESDFIIAIMRGKKQKNLDKAIRGLNNVISIVGKSGKYQLIRKAAQAYKAEFIAEQALDSSVDRMLSLAE